MITRLRHFRGLSIALLAAGSVAACAPRTSNITKNSDGSKTVVFECVRTAALPAPVPVNPDLLTYSDRTDQELVQASQTASAYCMQNGSLPMTSRVMTNPDGSRTVGLPVRAVSDDAPPLTEPAVSPSKDGP
jgi:hypothetical protein